ncbi:hypothetical protein LOZ80_08960 [Paenibacillus sp. HWE-109]|nr:hypothetical protein [Paenibacillus sp. HWE-109]UKS29038.1 hypothetical protein LOZ80_08960 [Paenibacillus sp. HWE-109]
MVKIRLNVHINDMSVDLEGGNMGIMPIDSYEFANLDAREDLLEDLRSLESRMKDELGYEVALIAYTQEIKETAKA